jgi:hypothetical protein
MPTAPNGTFALPDTIAALPQRPFTFSSSGSTEARAVLRAVPDELFRRLLRDQESESTLFVARHVIDAFLRPPGAALAETDQLPSDADGIAAQVAGVRDELAASVTALAQLDADVREVVLRQRAPLALLGGCWLDVVSQPATQPSTIVNRLFAQHVRLRGDGRAQQAVHHLRRRACESAGADLPDIAAGDFLGAARARPLTSLHGCFYLALSRLPANFLPEVVGVHYAFHALGVDDLLLWLPPVLPEPVLRDVLREYLTLAGPAERRRMQVAVLRTLELEREHVTMLGDLASWRAGLGLESRVAEIVSRHAPLAGSQHGGVRVGGRLLSETFDDPDLDLAAFLADLRESRHLRPAGAEGCRFLQAIKFGGAMFGIFDDREAAILQTWVETVQAGARPAIEISADTAGDGPAGRWADAIARSAPTDVVVAEAGRPGEDRELFHRLVNIENFANTLPMAAERAARCFEEAEILFTCGAGGRYTDATYFDYSPEALYERAERVYWDKLVNPYQPLAEIPDRDEVVFRQTTYHLTYLIDGAWLHRLGNLGRTTRRSDDMLFTIYADEMGRGDLRKNHITLTHRALASMDIKLPHIRDEAFVDQVELPDEPYGFAIQQLCMCLFPDRFYNEILGYNLAIEMYGSGEVRLHELQKLRHHGFDVCYEQAHLTIDNFSAGHAKQAADIIVSYLDSVRRTVGDAAVEAEWRRVWRGYASFAYFLEQPLLKRLATGDTPAELVI